MPLQLEEVRVVQPKLNNSQGFEMRRIKVGGAALNQTPLAWDENCANIISAIKQAQEQAVTLLCLPELCISGYGCEDAFFAAGTRRRALDSLLNILPHCSDIVVSVGLPIFHEVGLYNVSCLIANKKILGFSCKQFLANEGLHYEPRWFKPWPQGKLSEISIEGENYPFGDLCYDVAGILIGFEICEDAWVANRPGVRLAQSGVDIILNPSASHFAFDKFDTRKNFVKEGSRAFNCAYVYANHLGNESGRAIYDGGTLIANCGKLLAKGQRFSFKDVVLTCAVVDLELAKLARVRTAQNAEEAMPSQVSVVSFAADGRELAQSSEPQSSKPEVKAGWEFSANIKEEEFTRAVSLGLFDYLRKSYSAGFVVSLSGGADSAAVACLVRYCLSLAINELGQQGVRKKLPYIFDSDAEIRIDGILSKLLTTVYQSSANSGEVTRLAAAAVAAAVKSEHHEISIANIVAEYTSKIEASLAKKLNWKENDLVLQNIQARARGPAVWMYANIKNALLLATSNRSEVAVGYATMDGDTCGSISPIAGIDKAFLRKWLVWAEKLGPDGLGNLPALAAINKQEPTAELRPTAQTDEADLMPYVVLEYIERAAIRDKKDPAEVVELLKTQFPEAGKVEHLRWVKLFFTLWSKSQWKRERYAPAFHLDDESLDPKTWCRFPILSGSYKKELAELE